MWIHTRTVNKRQMCGYDVDDGKGGEGKGGGSS